MNFLFRTYHGSLSYDGDFDTVYQFLVNLNSRQLVSPDFTWTRWEWMFARASITEDHLRRIGLWFESGQLVGIVTPEDNLDEVFILCHPNYSSLYQQMLIYAEKNFVHQGKTKILISDDNFLLIQLATQQGFNPTINQDINMVYDLNYLPSEIDLKGHSYDTLEHPNFPQLNRVLWKEFNHLGEPVMDEVTLLERQHMFSSPHSNPTHFIAIKTPKDEYVSFAGSWWVPNTEIGFLEPVATDPSYRLRGLGKAAVFLSMLECKNKGAKQVLVGSGQSFYASVGFTIYNKSTWWVK